MKQSTTTHDLSTLHVNLLKILGNPQPSEDQVTLIGSLISCIVMDATWVFPSQLTEREMSCLMLAAKGMSSSETAKVLGIKSSTVETYREKIKRKLDCKTIAHAVFKGMQYGYAHSEID